MTETEKRILDRLLYSDVRCRTDWDKDEDIKIGFLQLEKAGCIQRPDPDTSQNRLHGFWSINEAGRMLMGCDHER